MENMTLTQRHEGREQSVLSNMSHLSCMLSYGTRCFNRTIWGTGNLQFSVCLCFPFFAVNSLAVTWWMFVYQSKRYSLSKDSDPDSPLTLPCFLPLFFLFSYLVFFPFSLYFIMCTISFLLLPFHNLVPISLTLPLPLSDLTLSDTIFLYIWLSEVMQGWLRCSKSNLDHCDYSLVGSLPWVGQS